MTLAINILLQLVKEVSCNWFQNLLCCSGDKLNNITNCSGKLQIFEVVKGDDSGHNNLQ